MRKRTHLLIVNMDIMGLSLWDVGAGNPTKGRRGDEEVASLKNYTVWDSSQDS